MYTFYAPISSKGQLVIPAKARKILNLNPSGRAKIVLDEKAKNLTIQSAHQDPLDELYGLLAPTKPQTSLTRNLERERQTELAREEATIAYWKSK